MHFQKMFSLFQKEIHSFGHIFFRQASKWDKFRVADLPTRPLWSIGEIVWSIEGVKIIVIEVKPVRIVRVW